jgi:hypothetical protein
VVAQLGDVAAQLGFVIVVALLGNVVAQLGMWWPC